MSHGPLIKGHVRCLWSPAICAKPSTCTQGPCPNSSMWTYSSLTSPLACTPSQSPTTHVSSPTVPAMCPIHTLGGSSTQKRTRPYLKVEALHKIGDQPSLNALSHATLTQGLQRNVRNVLSSSKRELFSFIQVYLK